MLTGQRVAPINLITFYGEPATNLDIDLRTKAGSFLAHWPPCDHLPNRLRWSGAPAVNLTDKLADPSELSSVDAEHWMHKAREGDALYVSRGARTERFLAYDVELNLAAPIRLAGGPDKYTVINISGTTLYDVLISRPTPEGRRVAWLDVLPAASSSAADAASKDAKAAKAKADLFEDDKDAAAEAKKPAAAEAAKEGADTQKSEPAAKPPAAAAQDANKPAAGEPAKGATLPALAADKKVPDTGVEITLSEPIDPKSPEVAAKTSQPLSERLVRAGLKPLEVEIFIKNYQSLFFEGDALIVACRLSPSLVDEKLPLSVFPEPAKTVRVAMVAMRNADPQLGSEVDRLIAQLGDKKFAAREAAQRRLFELGALAFPALQKSLNSADLEIVLRCERILLNQNQTPNPTAQVNQAGAAPAAAPAVVAPAAVRGVAR
jgi:hypothetical protein